MSAVVLAVGLPEPAQSQSLATPPVARCLKNAGLRGVYKAGPNFRTAFGEGKYVPAWFGYYVTNTRGWREPDNRNTAPWRGEPLNWPDYYIEISVYAAGSNAAAKYWRVKYKQGDAQITAEFLISYGYGNMEIPLSSMDSAGRRLVAQVTYCLKRSS